MNVDTVLAEYDVRSGDARGSRFILYGNRLVQQGPQVQETVPLAQVASVRVAFDRDGAILGWALALLVLAAGLALASGPLQSGLAGAVAKLGEPARRESFDAALLGLFNMAGALASLMPALAAAVAAFAVLLLVAYVRGRTTFTLSVAGSQRSCAVRGRDAFLREFGESLAARISALHGKG